MKSKTKFYVNDTDINKIFLSAQLGEVNSIKELTAGEFNAAYFVIADDKHYVLKIAPKDNFNTLTYEKNIMAQEVMFYNRISENTNVKVPHVFYFDDTKALIPSVYFIMEKLDAQPLVECKISKAEMEKAHENVGETVARLHDIKGASFGYEQNGLYANWYLAIHSMVTNLINDCKSKNKKAKDGLKLLQYIEKSRDILEKVEPTFTHFDLWDGNVFYKQNNETIELAVIDTERGFWGDCIGDFVSIEMFTGLKDKVSVKAYNKVAKNPIKFTDEEIIRFNIMVGYLGLIVHTEKFARYKLWQLKYYMNVYMAKYFYNRAFSALQKLL